MRTKFTNTRNRFNGANNGALDTCCEAGTLAYPAINSQYWICGTYPSLFRSYTTIRSLSSNDGNVTHSVWHFNEPWEKCHRILDPNISVCKPHATSGLATSSQKLGSSQKSVMVALLIKGKRLLKIQEKASRISKLINANGKNLLPLSKFSQDYSLQEEIKARNESKYDTDKECSWRKHNLFH